MSMPVVQREAATIGRYKRGDAFEFLPMSSRDIDRARIAAGLILDSYAFARGSYGLMIATLSDVAQVLPIQLAMMERNLIISYADTSPYEFGRIKAMIQRFDPQFVFGVSNAALDGLVMAKLSVADLFKGRVIWARPDAYERLEGERGFELRRWIEVGPALALECRCGDGAHVDPLEWILDSDDGEVLVSSRFDRARHFDRAPTGLRAEITHDICACGRPGPRVRL